MNVANGIEPTHARGAALGVGAAALFGVSAPLSKLLLTRTGPLTLAALLYLGAGLGLSLLALLARLRSGGGRSEAPLRPSDLPLLAGAVMTGGILGPFLLMFGLQRVSAVSGSLLLNLETPLTILLAVVLAREHLGLRQAGSALLILLGAGIVGQRPGDLRAEWLGVAAIAGASLSWAIDTNLSQRLALRDPVAFSRLKGFAGGTCMMAAALGRGETLPGAGVVVPALLLGWMSYGLSAVLFVLGLRAVGSSRMAAYFATAPFLGALVAIPVLGERLHRSDLLAMTVMAIGVALLLREVHDHLHEHKEVDHDHAHVHDDHHRHEHGPGEIVAGSHAHPHHHGPQAHAHPHAPDLHHRHHH